MLIKVLFLTGKKAKRNIKMKPYIHRPRNQKAWETGELILMMNHCGKKSLVEITEMINSEFGNERTVVAVEARAYMHGFKFGLKI